MVDDTSAFGAAATTEDAQIRTFLIADVRGYTVFTQERGDEAAAELAMKFAAVAREVLESRGGTVVELRGDEALAVFDSARQAIRASIELQRRFVDETVADPTLPLAVGIGLDAGEAVAVDDGFRGGALNLAARLCSIAGPAEVLASREVVHLARKVEGVAYVDRGSVQLKGLADPVHVIRLRTEANDPAEDMAFRRALGSAGARPAPSAGAIAANPYKGLRAFEEADAADFFGREELVEQLVEAPRADAVPRGRRSERQREVVGRPRRTAPAIRRGAIPGSEGWRIADMFPGAHPLDGLEAALLRAAPDPPSSLMDQLERDEHGLHRAVLRLLPSDRSELVLVIDQFEEVFTLVEDEAARTHFLGSLEAAATDPRSRLRVVATLRADFYDRPLLYRGFADLFKSRVEAVVPLSAEELERAISGPAERVDVSLEPGLVAAMLADVAEEPGALPLMEYALTELFDRRDGRTLFLEAYREIGGVSGALGRRAEELYAELDDDGKEAARQLFLRLVALGEGTEDTRRRVPRSEVASLDVDQQAMARVIDTFGASRQLSFDRDARTGAPTIELAHEAMLTAWPRLHRWIDAAREDLRTERRVAIAAREWTESDRDPSFLLSGSRLDQAEAWRGGLAGSRSRPEEREYLDASLAERERAPTEEEARSAHERELERRSFRRLRALVAILAVAAVDRRRPHRVRDDRAAGRRARSGTPRRARSPPPRSRTSRSTRSGASCSRWRRSRRRAARRDRVAGGGGGAPPSHGRVARRADRAGPRRDPRLEPEGVLRHGGTGEHRDDRPPRRDDRRLRPIVDRTREQRRERRQVLPRRLDARDGRRRRSAEGVGSRDRRADLRGPGRPGGVAGLSFDADGALVAAAWPEEGTVRVVEAATGHVVQELTGIDTFVLSTGLSPDGTRVVVGAPSRTSLRSSTSRPATSCSSSRDTCFPVDAVAWSPDGRWIATGASDSSVRVWDANTGQLEERLTGHTGVLTSVDWSPDSRRIVSGGSDGTARVWELEVHPTRGTVEVEGRQAHLLSAEQTQSGMVAAFSPDGQGVITGDLAIAAIKIWDLSVEGDAEVDNVPTAELLGPVEVGYLPDGRIVVPDDRGSVAVWEVGGDATEPVETLGPATGASGTPVVRVDPSPDGELVAMVPGFSNVVSVWNVETSALAFDFDIEGDEPISSMDWSGDGRYLALSVYDGSVHVLDADDDGRHTLVGSEPAPNAAICLAIAPDGRTIAVGTFNDEEPDTNHVSIWDRVRARSFGSST